MCRIIILLFSLFYILMKLLSAVIFFKFASFHLITIYRVFFIFFFLFVVQLVMLIDNCSRFVLLYLFFFLLKFLFARLLCFHKFVIFLSKKFISSRFFPYINYFSFVLSIIIYQEQFVNFQGLDFLHSNIKAEKFLIKKNFCREATWAVIFIFL